jgi:spore maturation protein SpmA
MAMNRIWSGFFLIAAVIALFRLVVFNDVEVFPDLVAATFDMSETAFRLALGLTGILTLWMGFMRIGEKSGMVEILARFAGPLMERIFPEIPKGHPAMAPIIMNISANMLGLDNAGTPLGLKAMKELQALNPRKQIASNAQIMFLVLNTSGLTLIPISVIMYRANMGAVNPTDVFLPILFATTCSTLAGLFAVAFYQKINLLDKVVIAYLGAIVGFLGLVVAGFYVLDPETMRITSQIVSNIILFGIPVSIILLAWKKRINAYSTFIEGAKEGFEVAISIIPFLVAILVSIAAFRSVGGMQIAVYGIQEFFALVGLDFEFVKALPTAFMKPLSGSGARGMMIDAMSEYGADSYIGRLASTFQGTTDTTLYVIAVYFGSVGIRKTKYAIGCGLFADFVGIVAAILIATLFFG